MSATFYTSPLLAGSVGPSMKWSGTWTMCRVTTRAPLGYELGYRLKPSGELNLRQTCDEIMEESSEIVP